MLLDLAISLAMGGDCLADIAQLRAHPQVFGPVASDPTVSRCLDALAGDAPAALAAIAAARAAARARAWAAAGQLGQRGGDHLLVVGHGVRPGVAGAQQKRQRLAGAGLPVVDEGPQRMETEAA